MEINSEILLDHTQRTANINYKLIYSFDIYATIIGKLTIERSEQKRHQTKNSSLYVSRKLALYIVYVLICCGRCH
jgi:hypothetical protein